MRFECLPKLVVRESRLLHNEWRHVFSYGALAIHHILRMAGQVGARILHGDFQ